MHCQNVLSKCRYKTTPKKVINNGLLIIILYIFIFVIDFQIYINLFFKLKLMIYLINLYINLQLRKMCVLESCFLL